MNKFLFASFFASAAIALSSCGGGPANADVLISTDKGDIYVDLYDDTPKHKDNFMKLAGEGYFDGTTFHRVIKDFMIQGGDPNSKEGATGQPGEGGPGWTIPHEITAAHFHKRGALSAARMSDIVNPNWESSGSQFYLVTGKKCSDDELNQMEMALSQQVDGHVRVQFEAQPQNQWIRTIDLAALQSANPDSFATVNAKIQNDFNAFRAKWPTFKLTPEQREVYKTQGGAPYLDAQYTVFGEVVQGIEVAEAISLVPTGAMNAPTSPIRMTMKVLK
jgi:cyclophilin family peptidyl-prolyl cis-trans isomerase